MAVTSLRTEQEDARPRAPGPDALDGRGRILRAAAQLFLERGYAETSLRTIAESASMQPASIYHHFESKDALLTEILEIGMHSVTNAFDDVVGQLGNDAEGPTRLRAHVAGHLHALFSNHAFTAAHVTVFPFAPDAVRRASVPERDAYEAQWTDLLTSVAPGLDEEGVRITRLALFGAMNSTVQWFDPSRTSLDGLAANIVDTLWHGLDRQSDVGLSGGKTR